MLGDGIAIPGKMKYLKFLGLLLAKLGHQVTLSDSLLLPHCLENCREAARCNDLEQQVKVSWHLRHKP